MNSMQRRVGKLEERSGRGAVLVEASRLSDGELAELKDKKHTGGEVWTAAYGSLEAGRATVLGSGFPR